MTGITLMVIGIIFFVIGIIIFSALNKKKEISNNGSELENIISMAIADGVLTNNEKNRIKQFATEKELDYNDIILDVENRISTFNSDSETELIDPCKRNGEDFEKFVVQKFRKEYFSIKEWAGDKYINGYYAETTSQPDILLEFKLKQATKQLAVECKWRQIYYNKGIEFTTVEQFARYKKFQKERDIPVFIAIGVGGKGASPEQLFVVPLQEIKNDFISINELKKYEKIVNSLFFFDIETNELK